MKNLYLGICLLLCGHILLAQNENNHWQLGALDINFSTDPPVVNTISSIFHNTTINPATISDANGNLLFAFDGQTFYNKNYQAIGTLSDGGSVNNYTSPIIVPHPTNSNRYYTFWGAFNFDIGPGTTYPSKYFYAIIDFTATNPLGVITESGLMQYNGGAIENEDNFRAISVVKIADNSGYWIVVQRQGTLLSYKLTSSGLSANPVVSTPSGYIYLGNKGNFRIIPDYANANNMKLYGTYIPNSGSQYLYSMDFNSTTGQFYNFQQTAFSEAFSVSFEFSNDYQKIYYISGGVFVKNLNSLNTPGRQLNEFNTTTAPIGFSFIQKDKYNNLLIGSSVSTLNRNKYLHKIVNPDSYSNSTVLTNYISLNGNTVEVLPQLVPSRSCVNDIVLSSAETNTSFTYAAANSITTNNSYAVNNGSNIVLQAENAIFLNPNTEIKSGAVFEARIDECPYNNNLFDRRSIVSSNQDSDNIAQADNQKSVTFLQLYPNPSNETTKIGLKNDTIKTLTVSSMEGLTMFSRDILKDSYDLYVGNYRKGIYIVTVQTVNGEIYTEKLMKN